MNWARSLLSLLGTRLPRTAGTLEVSGAKGTVLIRRDEWGVPYIQAANDADAWYALGFCHGQDRSFQLESLLRAAHGTVAELVGADGLQLDRVARRIGFLGVAREYLPQQTPEVQGVVESYVAGINEGRSVGSRRSAHEFALLRTRPTPWRPEDVFAVIALQSFVLCTNWDVELARLKILIEDGADALAALDPTYPEWQPVTSPPMTAAGPALDGLSDDLSALAQTVGAGGASNNWALAADRTASGRPLLANDPHLSPTLPPHWYLTQIRTPDWAVAGATFVGSPAVLIGHNGFCAWGVTVGMVDNTDLFLEEVGPDGRSVRAGDRFEPCEVRSETITVKGGESVTEEVLVTPRGPIVGPAMGGEIGALSIRATWLQPQRVDGFFSMPRVRGFEEFRRAFRFWPIVPFNVVYADESGTVGWQLAAQAPRRRKGHGTIPLPGWDPEVGWDAEPVPFDEMPYLSNPACGFIATANAKPVQDAGGPYLGVDWIEGYRQARIAESLAARDDWDLAGTFALQMDVTSLPWREMRDLILAIPPQDGATSRALQMLADWDGRLEPGSSAGSIFELFVFEMTRRVADSRAPNSARYALGRGFTLINELNTFAARRVGHLVRLLREQPPGWFEDGWEREMSDALRAALQGLEREYGEDASAWGWGQIRQLTLRHPVGRRKPLDGIFNRGPFPCGGDSNTPAQAGVDPLNPTANPGFIASARFAVEVGNWEEARFILPGGQSGNPLSPHYADQLPLWQRGETITLAWSVPEVERITRETLQLTPKP